MSQNNFKQLESEVLEILKSGRPNWDIPHTLTSVYYMKKLLEVEIGSEKILISTMYLHDIGYFNVKADLSTHKGTMSVKNDHMKNGIIIAESILEKLNYTKNQISQILYLIGCHDDLNDLSDSSKQLVFEADSLGQIDISRAPSNLKGEDRKIFIESFEKIRVPKFRTQVGIKLLSELFPQAKEFYLNN
jgi:hypothetical protein